MAEALATSWSASVSAAASAPLDEAGVVKKAKMAAATPTEEVSATKKGKKASAGTGSKAAKPPKAKKELFEASSATGNASDAVVSLFDALGANGPHDASPPTPPHHQPGPARWPTRATTVISSDRTDRGS
jgi:hypothetical protein